MLLADKDIAPLMGGQYVQVTLHVGEYPGRKDRETPGGSQYLKKVARRPAGTPFYVVLNSRGELIGDAFFARLKDERLVNIGYPLNDGEIAKFLDLLRSTSKLSEAQCARIDLRLKQLAKKWLSTK
ncbi:MAG: hypothetical protein ACHQ50_02025 [Fimbriimonadales bacterium]